MSLKILYTLLFISQFIFAQVPDKTITIKRADTLNQFNKNHKKHGFWVVYLDSMVSPCDSAKSVFYAYQYFDNGFAVNVYIKRKPKNRNIESTLKRGEQGKPVLLSGSIKVFLKGQPEFDENFFNGKPLVMSGIRCNKAGEIIMREVLNYAIPYKNERGTFYYEMYGPNNKIDKCAFFRKTGTKYDLQPTACKKS